MSWFKVSVESERMQENGMYKKVTEVYLLDAVSYTEAEARTLKEITIDISGEFKIADIKRIKLAEIFQYSEAEPDGFFLATVKYVTLDERSGMEKEKPVKMLVIAPDFDTALKTLHTGMRNTMVAYKVANLTEFLIEGIYPFSDDQITEVKF